MKTIPEVRQQVIVHSRCEYGYGIAKRWELVFMCFAPELSTSKSLRPWMPARLSARYAFLYNPWTSRQAQM